MKTARAYILNLEIKQLVDSVFGQGCFTIVMRAFSSKCEN